MTALEWAMGIAFLAAAVAFVIGLHLMRTPRTARRGNLVSASGMAVAVAAAAVGAVVSGSAIGGATALALGAVVGSLFGALAGRRVAITAIPQLVSLFNAVGGGAAAVVAIADYLHRTQPLSAQVTVPVALDVVIGAVTFSGSLIAAGKLQGIVPGRSIRFPGSRVVTGAVTIFALGGAVLSCVFPDTPAWLGVTLVAALGFGVLMVLPIGGADAPVVVSLLNAFTGLAVAMGGFVLGNQAMIIGGGLVGAAGTILTLQMAAAMNRSVVSILVGGFGATAVTAQSSSASTAPVRTVTADDAAIQLAYAHHVVIVPGYGLAAGQAQHELAQLASILTDRGVQVEYAIHPVAGRMPGHMNVLLAEVNVPYEQLLQLDDANRALDACDVALVVGANDVTNPAARRPGNPVSGMPILDVDHAKSVIVLKRSMSPGYAGIPNELFTAPQTGMLFADAKQGLADVITAIKSYVTA